MNKSFFIFYLLLLQFASPQSNNRDFKIYDVNEEGLISDVRSAYLYFDPLDQNATSVRYYDNQIADCGSNNYLIGICPSDECFDESSFMFKHDYTTSAIIEESLLGPRKYKACLYKDDVLFNPQFYMEWNVIKASFVVKGHPDYEDPVDLGISEILDWRIWLDQWKRSVPAETKAGGVQFYDAQPDNNLNLWGTHSGTHNSQTHVEAVDEPDGNRPYFIIPGEPNPVQKGIIARPYNSDFYIVINPSTRWRKVRWYLSNKGFYHLIVKVEQRIYGHAWTGWSGMSYNKIWAEYWDNLSETTQYRMYTFIIPGVDRDPDKTQSDMGDVTLFMVQSIHNLCDTQCDNIGSQAYIGHQAMIIEDYDDPTFYKKTH
jgi:hypothetical protein